MNTSKGKILVALLAAVMMAAMAVPLVSAVPTQGDEVTRDALEESHLLGLRIDYRMYSNNFQWDEFPDGSWASVLFPGDIGAWAGEMNVTVTDDQGAIPARLGEKYTTFCIDWYSPIASGDVLQVDSNLANGMSAEEALIVNYILAMYEPTDDLSGAAIQCAIWYFLTEEYGTYAQMVAGLPPVYTRSLTDVQYQFMTDPDPVDPVNDLYDAKINVVSYPSFAADPSVLRDAAMAIVADVEAANVGLEPLKYPYSISITPDTQTVGTGTLADVVIEVLDQYGDPFEGAVVCEKLWWASDPIGTLWEGEDITDVNGQIIWSVFSDEEDTFYISACIRGGEAIWVFDPAIPMVLQSLAIPNCPCDEANVVFEEQCYYPDGHTPGFWKNNARKYLESDLNGGSKKYVGVQVPFEDYHEYLEAIDDLMTTHCDLDDKDNFTWLMNFDDSVANDLAEAYGILSYGGPDPMLKAQKHMLSALLTVFWYGDQMEDGTAWYLDGCVEICGEDVNIADAIHQMLLAYDSGDYELAHEIAGALNEQGDS